MGIALADVKALDEERLRSDKSRFGSARHDAAFDYFYIHSFSMTSGEISKVVIDEFYRGHDSPTKKKDYWVRNKKSEIKNRK